jgi:hypothetical protein
MWRMQEVLFRMSLKSEPTSTGSRPRPRARHPQHGSTQLARHLVSKGLRHRHPRRTLIGYVRAAGPVWRGGAASVIRRLPVPSMVPRPVCR